MKSSFITLGAVFLGALIVAAQPHGRHAHAHADKHAKRKLIVVTDYVDITETVLLTATVWVDGKGNTIAPPVTGDSKSTVRAKPFTRSRASPGIFHEPAKTTVAPVETTPPAPAPVKVEPTPSPEPVPAPVEVKPEPVPTPAYVAPVVEEVKPEPVPEPKIEPAPAPVEVKPEPVPTPAYVAPVVEQPKVEPQPQPQPQAVAPQPQPQIAAALAPAKDVGGPCSSGSPCTGDITFYQAGLGACGETHDGLSEFVVALPHGMMGTQSNGNPFCGRTVSITKNGKTTSAKVVDKCMGCKDGDLDLSEKAFAALGIDQSVGRTTAEWFFTS